MTDEVKCDYYSCREDDERLVDDSIGEAVNSWADNACGDLPERVTVYGYRRMKPILDPMRVLEHEIQRLDEEYGDPDGDMPMPTQAMIDASKAFCAVVEREFPVWACECVSEQEVTVVDYIQETTT